ncbi:Palmitoyltransferase [Entamoeba marina]
MVNTTDADSVPSSYFSVKDQDLNSLEYCEICQQYKAERVHHCSVINKCVYRYDHYCTIVNSTLGLHNYKYFFLFIFYMWISSIVSCYLFYKIFSTFDTSFIPYPLILALTLFFSNILLSLTTYSLYFLITISFNLTTKEFIDYFRQVLETKSFPHNPYCKSVLENWREMLLVPSDKMLIVGFFPTKSTFEKELNN